MFGSRNKLSISSRTVFFQAGVVIFLLLSSPGLTYAVCSLPDSIKTDTTITGTCTLVKDLYINSGVTLTLAPPCTLYMAALSDSKNLGEDPLRIEILVAGGFRVAGNSGPTGRVVFRSNRTPSGNAGDWFGIRRVDSTAQIIVNYAEFLDGFIPIYASWLDQFDQIYNRSDTIRNSRFENWRIHAIANTMESGGFESGNSTSSTARDSLVISGNIFSGSDTAIEFTHDFGLVIDSNQFLNQKGLSVFLDDYSGKITRNYFYADSSSSAILVWASAGDSMVVGENVVEGYYSYAHIRIEGAAGVPAAGFHVRGNKLITGKGTSSSPYGLYTNYGSTNYKLLVRGNIFSNFGAASIYSSALAGDDFGDVSAQSPGNNIFLLPCNRNARAIVRQANTPVKAEGNWYGTATPDSSTLFYPVDKVDFRPFLTVPAIPFYGKLGRTSTWAAGNHTLEGDFSLDHCAALTLNPGVKVLAAANKDLSHSGGDTTKCEFNVRGTLTSLGGLNAADSILFTSASSTPANGDWGGVVMDCFARGNFEFTLFDYADTALAVRGDTATVLVYNSTFTHFNKAAVSSRSAKTRLGGIVPVPNPPDCGRNNFLMNTATSGAKAVIKSTSPGGTIKAEGNWWSQAPPPSSWFSGMWTAPLI